ncbi:MAG: hypothetical protein U1F76_08770 [Candidatus Competibacteraceae bacterium]
MVKSLRFQLAEETILFVVNPGSKEEFVGFAGITSITKGQCPETIDLDGIAVAILKLAEGSAGAGIKREHSQKVGSSGKR